MKALSILTLPLVSLLTACTDPIVGEWTLTPAQMTVPLDDGTVVDVDLTGSLDVLDSYDTTMVLYYGFEGSEVGSTSFGGVTAPLDDGTYSVDLTTDGSMYQLGCDLAEDTLGCVDSADGVTTFEFTMP